MRAMKRTIAIMPKMNNIVRTGLATRTAQWLLLLVVCSQSCLTFNLGSLSKTLDTGSSDLISGAKAAPLSAQNMEEDNPLQVVASSTGALGSHPSSLMSRQPSYPLLLRKAPAEASKGQPSVETRVVQEVECTESVFLSPFHEPIRFSLTESVYWRVEKSCKWNLIGTEPCIPMLTCETTSHMRSCEEQYLEVVDGGEGYLKLCGKSGVVLKTASASQDLRDLYVHFKVTPAGTGAGKPGNYTLFNCTVVCSKRGQGTPLPRTFKAKANPKCYCGTRPNDDKIVGGTNAKKFEFPWLVALVETDTRQPFCGGSIINDRFILTAGHCIKGKYVDYRNIQVVINGHYFDSSPAEFQKAGSEPKKYPLAELHDLDAGNGSRRVSIDEIIVHPLYVSENNDFDIALLHLDSKLELTPRVGTNGFSSLQQPRSICLPALGSYLRTFSNKKAVIAGWGLPGFDADGTPNILQKLEVNVFSPGVCKDMFAHRVNRRMMCAGHRQGGKDSCSGDSGSPLILEEGGKWMQVGSVSWGEGCGEEGHPGVYFRTTEGVQWVNYQSNHYLHEDGRGASWCIVP